MLCDTKLKARQTIQQRKAEVITAVKKLEALLASKKVVATVGAQGGIAFTGWNETDRDGVTDACAYRRILSTGSAMPRMELARAEALAGRTVDRTAIAQGLHSHDGGRHWHKGH